MAESTPLVGSVTERIRSLDGVRGIAIVLVLAGHVVANFQPLHPDHRYWLGAFANSSAGVRLFFVLSGYLITWLLLREWTATGRISIGQFYRRRALRIFPAFYAYLFVITGLTFFRPTGVNGETFLAAATFTWNYHHLWISIPPEGAWNLGHLWTLALEQQFYGPLAALGTTSYSLYFWQQLFLSDIGPLRHGQMLLPLVAAIVVATLSYRFIEQPFLRLKRPPPRIVPSFAQTSGAKPAH